MTQKIGRDPKSGVSVQQLFQLLSRRQRSHLLVDLTENDLLDIEEYVERGMQRSQQDRETVEVEFYHTHLPTLDDAGIVEWDAENDLVKRGPNFEDVRPMLTLLVEHEETLPGDWP